MTDFLGLLLLTPFIRMPVASYLFKRMQLRVVANGGSSFGNGTSPFGANMRNPGNPGNQHNPEGGDTFEGDFEHKADPNSSRLEDKQDPKS